jgi:radical SAM superfamily enzyme YgiQ (UPF0313 family)
MRHVIILGGTWPTFKDSGFNFFSRSVGPYGIKHWVSNFGFKSQVIDFCQLMTAEEIFPLVEQFIGPETIALALSTTYWPYPAIEDPENILEVIRKVKEKYPKLKIVYGGAIKPKTIDLFDRGFTGENVEDIFLSWLQSQVKQHLRLNKKFNITQLEHRFDQSDCIMPYEVLPIELGRGCIFKCKFCILPNIGKPKHTYQRPYNLILDEIRWNHEQFGVTNYNFVDDTVNEDPVKVKNLSQISKNVGFDIVWNGFLRADLVAKQKGSAEQLIESGMRSCFFGIESFHPKAASYIGKPWNAKYAKEFLPRLFKDTWKEKVNIQTNFIVGLPGEGKDSLIQTRDWCKDNDIGWVNFDCLHLTQQAGNIDTQSEFGKNASMHGYKSVDGVNWDNGIFKMADARQLTNELNLSIKAQKRVSSWRLFSVMTLGYDIEVARFMTLDQLRPSYPLAVIKFKDNYISMIRSLKR